MNLEKVRPTVGETVGGGRMGANVSGAYTSDYTPLSPDRQNLLALAQRLHTWGANVTAILPGSKIPAHKWKHWQATRQTVGEVAGLPWRSAVAVGVIDGVGGWRDFDFDDCPTFDPVALVLAELGLPVAYPWVIRTGEGWRVSVLCLDDLPAEILTAKAGPGGGPGVFTFAPKRAGDFDHLELRWRNCQTILWGKHPTAERGYTFAHGSPTSPPAAVPLGRVLRAALAVGELPKHETRPTAAPSTRQVAPSAAKPAEPGRLSAYSAAALSRELDALAHAREGERNKTLNRAAFALGQLVGAGWLDRFDVETRLESVALELGLDAAEIGPTIKSGLDDGEAIPRDVPDLPAHPTAAPIDALPIAEQDKPATAAGGEVIGDAPAVSIADVWRVLNKAIHHDAQHCDICGTVRACEKIAGDKVRGFLRTFRCHKAACWDWQYYRAKELVVQSALHLWPAHYATVLDAPKYDKMVDRGLLGDESDWLAVLELFDTVFVASAFPINQTSIGLTWESLAPMIAERWLARKPGSRLRDPKRKARAKRSGEVLACATSQPETAVTTPAPQPENEPETRVDFAFGLAAMTMPVGFDLLDVLAEAGATVDRKRRRWEYPLSMRPAIMEIVTGWASLTARPGGHYEITASESHPTEDASISRDAPAPKEYKQLAIPGAGRKTPITAGEKRRSRR